MNSKFVFLTSWKNIEALHMRGLIAFVLCYEVLKKQLSSYN
uniref:Uncharacterized protein n=1 Tax=Arundo donax TaxID=35708 RepID=A0A0A9AE29_ARUDO